MKLKLSNLYVNEAIGYGQIPMFYPSPGSYIITFDDNGSIVHRYEDTICQLNIPITEVNARIFDIIKADTQNTFEFQDLSFTDILNIRGIISAIDLEMHKCIANPFWKIKGLEILFDLPIQTQKELMLRNPSVIIMDEVPIDTFYFLPSKEFVGAIVNISNELEFFNIIDDLLFEEKKPRIIEIIKQNEEALKKNSKVGIVHTNPGAVFTLKVKNPDSVIKTISKAMEGRNMNEALK